ncbi:unnamed protein product [Discula destructiva]
MTLPTPLQLTAALLLAITALLLRLYHIATHRRPYTTIPYNQPSTRQLLGDIPSLNAEAQRVRDPARMTASSFAALRSPIIQLFLAPFWKPLVFVNDTREVEDLLQNRTRDFDKALSIVEPFRPVVPGASICKVKGPLWVAQVRLWSDVISVGYLRDVAAPLMHAAAEELVALFGAKAEVAGGRPFWVAEDFKIATFDVIWKAMLGTDLQGLRNEREAVVSEADGIVQEESLDAPANMATAPKCDEWNAGMYFMGVIPATVMSPLPRVLHFFYSLTPTYRKHWATKNKLKEECFESSRARLAEDGADEKKDVCALDRALRRFAKVSRSDVYKPTTDDMYDELLLLLMSGHETTASLLAWTAKILTNAPTEQTKLRSALHAHFPKPGTPSPGDILAADIPYLDASIEELVRIANIVPELVRETSRDTEVLGHRIPKGTTVVSSLYVGNKPFPPDIVPNEVRSENSRNNKGEFKSFWQEDIDEYRPERWLMDDGTFDAKALPRLAFSTGPRPCSGRKFAQTNFRIMLVVLITNLEFLPIPEELNSNDATLGLSRSPCHCFARIKAI